MTHKEEYLRSLEDTFAEALLTVESKVQDYAEDNDVFSNFRFAANAAGVTVEQVFLVLLGIKLARLKNLLLTDREPNNESVDDTLVDDINYNGILKAYRQFKTSTNPDYAYAGSPDLDHLVNYLDVGVVEPAPGVEEKPATQRLKEFFGISTK